MKKIVILLCIPMLLGGCWTIPGTDDTVGGMVAESMLDSAIDSWTPPKEKKPEYTVRKTFEPTRPMTAEEIAKDPDAYIEQIKNSPKTKTRQLVGLKSYTKTARARSNKSIA
ncbi:MAG: hypothetical protein LBF37_03375 [Rickettsiales bacterium]|jgi:hypothetical protein|nr:hypothetical protein [Rickettsiales bacterium]